MEELGCLHAHGNVRKKEARARSCSAGATWPRSITRHSDATSAVVGTNTVYAAIHNFGGKAGRGCKVEIPARPFLRLTQEDEDDIERNFAKFLVAQTFAG